MKEKYDFSYKLQIISLISFAASVLILFFLVYNELSYASIIIMGAIAAVSLITTATSGLIKSFIGHKMGLKSTKKDSMIVGVVFILAIIYFALKYFQK